MDSTAPCFLLFFFDTNETIHVHMSRRWKVILLHSVWVLVLELVGFYPSSLTAVARC